MTRVTASGWFTGYYHVYLLEMSHAREEICIAIEYEEPQKKDEEKRKTKGVFGTPLIEIILISKHVLYTCVQTTNDHRLNT